jgi:UDPglucose 6-dehydrogenase
MSSPVVGFVGLTHLGVVSAVGTSAKGFRVVCYDSDSTRIRQIAGGRMPILEPDLEDLALRSRSQLSYSDRIEDLGSCDIVYISSDVATDDRGESDLSEIYRLISAVIPALEPNALLCILCQVPPGFTRGLSFDPARLFYQVETLVFGRAVERVTKPERFIIGCADPSRPLPRPYSALLAAFECAVLPMHYESAELAKIAINCCLAASVCVANTLADLAERIGADWHEIVPALRLDRRIGPYSYLTPGLGIAGGNLERDLATVLRLSAALGSEASVVTAFLKDSAFRRDWVLRLIHREVLTRHPQPTIAILGLAYKEQTNSTKNSPSLALIENLQSWPIRVYDPAVPAKAVSHPTLTAARSSIEAADGSHALVIMTAWPEFKALAPGDLARVMAGRAIVDPFRVLEPKEVHAAGLSYFTLGAPPHDGTRTC